MKHLLTLILVVLSTACGGAEFSGVDSVGAGGEDSAAGTGSVTVTGGGGAGGTSAMGGTAGSSVGGGSMGGSSAGAAACEFDAELLVAALPKALVWETMTATSGSVCVTCHSSPCQTIDVISWGAPERQADGTVVLRPNTNWPMVSLDVGDNDGSCSAKSQCGSKLTSLMVFLTVEEGTVTGSRAAAVFQANNCTDDAGADVSMWSSDLELEVSEEVTGLHFGCAK